VVPRPVPARRVALPPRRPPGRRRRLPDRGRRPVARCRRPGRPLPRRPRRGGAVAPSPPAWRRSAASRDDELLAAGVDPAHLDHRRYVKARGALEGADLFDAEFFGLSPRQAEIIDPQHRLFLECAWQALEDAGYPPSPDAPRVGVFAGVNDSGYGRALADDPELAGAVGRLPDRARQPRRLPADPGLLRARPDRPGVDVQTACSTSLVAVHMARLASCSTASATWPRRRRLGAAPEGAATSSGGRHRLAGRPHPRLRRRGLGDGRRQRRRRGGAQAAGRRLADGDTVRAVLRGSAVNNDGGRGKVGFTAPRPRGRRR
jgi:hypothetical protein